MLSEQFIQVLNLCKKYNVLLSHNEIAILCTLNKEYFDGILKMLVDCDEQNKKLFLEIMKTEEYIIYHRYKNILDIITDLNSSYIEELTEILKRPGITRLPSFFDYLNMYYYLTTSPRHILSSEFKTELFLRIPEAEDVYEKNKELTSLKQTLKSLLLNQIDEEYEYFVLNKDIIYFEDDAEGLIDDLNNFFDFRNKDKEFEAFKLVRSIKQKNMPEKRNVIKVDFKNNQ